MAVFTNISCSPSLTTVPVSVNKARIAYRNDNINTGNISMGNLFFPKDIASKDNSLLKLLDVLLSNQTNGEETKRILENDFNIPVTEKLERRRNEMCNLSEGILNRGIEQGILFSLKSLLKNNKEMSAIDAIAMLGIPSAEHSKYLELLATQK